MTLRNFNFKESLQQINQHLSTSTISSGKVKEECEKEYVKLAERMIKKYERNIKRSKWNSEVWTVDYWKFNSQPKNVNFRENWPLFFQIYSIDTSLLLFSFYIFSFLNLYWGIISWKKRQLFIIMIRQNQIFSLKNPKNWLKNVIYCIFCFINYSRSSYNFIFYIR